MSHHLLSDSHNLSIPSTTDQDSQTQRPLLGGLGGQEKGVDGMDRSSNSHSSSPRTATVTTTLLRRDPTGHTVLPNEVPPTSSSPALDRERERDRMNGSTNDNDHSPDSPPRGGEVKVRVREQQPQAPASPFTQASNRMSMGGGVKEIKDPPGTFGTSTGRSMRKLQIAPVQVEMASITAEKDTSSRLTTGRSSGRSRMENSFRSKRGGALNSSSDHILSNNNNTHPYRFGYEHGHRVSWKKALQNHFDRKWVLNPNARWRPYWNLTIFFLVMYYIVEIPLRLGFKIDTCNQCATTVIHLLCDIFFLIDCLFVQTRTSFFIEDSNNTVLETSWRKIIKKYCRSWFTMDLLTSVPIHHILVYYYDVHTHVYVSAFVQFSYLARMGKVARFMDLLQYYHSVELSAGTVWSDLLKVVKFILGFFIISHLSACMWMFIALAQRVDDSLPTTQALWDIRTWPGNLGYTLKPNMTHVLEQWSNYPDVAVGENQIYDAQTQLHLVDSVVPLTVDLSYLMALYWSVSTMTTVGYGDILPRNDVEIAYACLVIFIGAVTFGYIISNVSTIIQIEDDADTKIRDKITSINAYMAYRKLPPDLQKKIRNHYEYQWKRKTVYDEKEILQNLPTYLRTRVALYLNQDLIRNVAFLRDLGSDCLALLVTELKPFRVGAGYWIFKQGSLGHEMCFVHDGTVEVLGKKNRQLAILQKGSYFGEHSILSSRPTKRSASVRALTTAELFALTKESFEEVLKVYPELREEVIAHAEARLKEAIEGKAERDYNKIAEVVPFTSTAISATPRDTPSAANRTLLGSTGSTHDLPLPISTGAGLGLGGGTPMQRPMNPMRMVSVPATFGSPNLAALGIRGAQPGAQSVNSPLLGAAAAPGGGLRVSSNNLGFNPYLSLPNSRPEDSEDENHIRRTVLKGKEQLEAIMHPELAEEIRLESMHAEALLDAQIEAEKAFLEANVGMISRTSLTDKRTEHAASNPYFALNARPSVINSLSGIPEDPRSGATSGATSPNGLNMMDPRMSRTGFSLDAFEPPLTGAFTNAVSMTTGSTTGPNVDTDAALHEPLKSFLAQLSSTLTQSLAPLHQSQAALNAALQQSSSSPPSLHTSSSQESLEELIASVTDFSEPQPWRPPSSSDPHTSVEGTPAASSQEQSK